MLIKIWRNNPERPNCPRCAGMEGEQREIGGPFSEGVDAPPLHPHCDCSLDFVQQEEPPQ